MDDRYFNHIVGCLGDAHERANNGWVKVTDDLVFRSMDLLKEQQERIERLQPKKGKWIFTGEKNAYGGTVIQCPFCEDKYAAHDPHSEHFCRNCGAQLVELEGDGDDKTSE